MCWGTYFSAAPVISHTIKIGYIVISLIEMITEFASAVRAYQQSRKHILIFACYWLFACSSASAFLYLFPNGTVYNWFVNIFKYRPILFVILITLFIFVWLRIGFKVYHITAILLFGKYIDNCWVVPFIRIFLRAFQARTAYPFTIPIVYRSKDFFFLQPASDLVCT